jgi:hypothetical protein
LQYHICRMGVRVLPARMQVAKTGQLCRVRKNNRGRDRFPLLVSVIKWLLSLFILFRLANVQLAHKYAGIMSPTVRSLTKYLLRVYSLHRSDSNSSMIRV